jgi:hypothetical protein
MARLALALFALVALERAATASAADVFGLGSDEAALCGASSARVHGFAAGYYDPAGLTGTERPEGSFGVLGFGAALRSQSGGATAHYGMTDPVGILVGAATPVPFTGWLARRLWVGLALYILPDAIARVIAHRPEEPFFPLYDNRTQRLVVLPALAVRIVNGLSLGIGFNYLAGLSGHVSSSEGATRAPEARVDEALFSTLAVNLGARWQVRPRLALALVYRQQFSVPFRTISRNLVAGQPIDVNVDAEGLYAPHQLVAGAAFALAPVMLSLDVGWSRWSDWRGPYVAVSSELPLVGAISASPPRLDYNDTASVRLGVEWSRRAGERATVLVRSGYGFESSPIPASQPASNLLDGDKHRLAAGAGVRFGLGGHAVRLDAHGQLDLLQPRTLAKPDGPSIRSDGFVWAAGFLLTVEQ